MIKFDKNELLKPENIISAIFVLVLAAAVMIFVLTDKQDAMVVEGRVEGGSARTGVLTAQGQSGTPPEVGQTAGTAEASGTFAVKMISVYVVGSVNKPGVYSIAKGKLIFDAISAAGGLAPDADPLSVNMAYALTANAMIFVKPAGGGGAQASIGQNSVISAGVGLVADVSGSGGAAVGTVKVNINTADAASLMTLPGVGESTAADIIAYRSTGGVFEKIEDIMKVPGIKDSKFQKMKDYITVE